MRKATLAKLTVLTIGGMLLTSSIVAQVRSRRTGSTNQVAQIIRIEKADGTKNRVPDNGPAKKTLGYTWMFGLMDAQSDVAGRTLTVTSNIRLHDIKQRYLYAWQIEVERTDFPAPKFVKFYEEQVFAAADADEHSYSFRDALDLDPGTYFVRLRLHTFHRSMNAQQMQHQIALGDRMLQGPQRSKLLLAKEVQIDE